MRRWIRAALTLAVAAAALPGCITAIETGEDDGWQTRHERLMQAERRMDAIERTLPH